MSVITKLVLIALLWVLAPAASAAASDTVLFRLFLTDGRSIVSYGEFVRVDDRVVFSMAMGGTDTPRLHVTSLPASAVDWERTDRHAVSTRYQQYARTRGEEDFTRLTDDVAAVLNEVLLTTDRARALEIAQRARATLVEWPRARYGYRQGEVSEFVAILDEAISGLRAAAGMSSFEVELVAMTPPPPLEPVAEMPSIRDQVAQAFLVVTLTERAAERVALLQTALVLLDEAGALLPAADVNTLRRSAETQIRAERTIDAQYSRVSERLMRSATRAAERARIDDVERVLGQIPAEDARLGHRRPEMVQALRASVQVQLDAARQLRLLQDQWEIRRSLYRDYQRTVGSELQQLVKLQPALEDIRRLDGPAPSVLLTLRAGLLGGAERLERIQMPADLRATHDLLVSAWRFAESAVNGRYEAAQGASMGTAWEASSAAAGALLLLARVQQEIRELIEPPRLR